MLPSPLITSSTTPFSVKDILKLELQQQSQQHQLQFISCFGLSGALTQPRAFPNKPFRSHSPPSCMLAGRDSPSPISSSVSESDERMSYLNTLTAQDRLAESGLQVEMFGNPAQNHSADLRLETEQEDQDSSEYILINDKHVRVRTMLIAVIGNCINNRIIIRITTIKLEKKCKKSKLILIYVFLEK